VVYLNLPDEEEEKSERVAWKAHAGPGGGEGRSAAERGRRKREETADLIVGVCPCLASVLVRIASAVLLVAE
jgi:hypothetical protein